MCARESHGRREREGSKAKSAGKSDEPDPHEEPHDVGLLLLVELRNVSVSTHLIWPRESRGKGVIDQSRKGAKEKGEEHAKRLRASKQVSLNDP
jgi:hypothetical protein